METEQPDDYFTLHPKTSKMFLAGHNQQSQVSYMYSHSYAYKIPRSKTNYHMYLFFPRTIQEWNSLANETVNAPNLKAFKKSLPSDQGQTKRC